MTDYTPAEEQYIQGVADKVSNDWKRKKAFDGRRNRSAWKRMNRPEKSMAQERGGEIIMNLLAKREEDWGFGSSAMSTESVISGTKDLSTEGFGEVIEP